MPDSLTVLDAETRAQESPAEHKAEVRLWLRLLTCTTLIENEVRSRLRDQFEVTLPRFDLMAQLRRVPEGMTLGELSRRMMVSNGNLTGLVERLVASGLVERVRNPEDRRAAFVRLAPAGRRAFAQMAERHAAWIGELLDGLSESDTAQLMRLLGRMKQSVRAGVGRC